ncbi:flagellar basal body-associated FliL family protein [Clostridium paraputrificum]|uniref:flagellar basal body-associated FliL family protein n=1 Tax=Clostridium TaxID=1485 RepID=UPI003D33CC8E
MAKKDKKENKDVEKSSGKFKTIFLILIAFIVLGAGTFGGVYFFMQSRDNSQKVISEIKVPVGEEIMINLSDSDAKRYLKAKVNVSYDKKDKKAAKEIEEKAVEIKDKTIFYLKSKVAKDFEAGNEEKLKKELVLEINKILDQGKIVDVYFDELLTQ